MRILLGIILYALAYSGLHAQCSLEGPFTINDFDVLELELDISGLQNGDLSSSTQGICGVAIEFEHDRVGNLLVELESPSGQVVTLIGPNGPFGLTNFTNWDISFVPCASTAAPDGSFGPFWTNQNAWQNFGNYDGSYYPFSGCLEDFDTGSANGTWTFIIRDAYQFDEGVIESITLFFCDPTGVDCEFCNAGEIAFQQSDTVVCEDQLPITGLDFEWTGFPDTNNYSYSFLIVNADTIVNVLDSLQIDSLDVGAYEICGLSYDKNDSASLFGFIGPAVIIPDLLDSISQNEICASLSENCLSLTIASPPDTVVVDTTFCIGEFIILQGDTISQAGNYSYTDSSGICDQQLEYTVYESNIIEGIQGLDTLTCLNDTLNIQALLSGSGPNASLYWYSGEVLLPFTSENIPLHSTGIYTLVLEEGNCRDSFSFEVIGDLETPYFSLSDYDTLSCLKNTLKVYPDSTNAESWYWILPEGDTIVSDTLSVEQEGTYHYTALGQNSCFTVDSFYVPKASDIFQAEIDTSINICGVDSIVLRPFEVNTDLNYDWQGPSGFSATVADTFTLEPGLYILMVSDSGGNCVSMDSFTFELQTPLDTPSISSDSLSCQLSEVQLNLDSVNPNYSYRWVTPGNDTLTEAEPKLREDGPFILTISRGSNCFIELEHIIFRSNDFPSYNILGDTISCQDSIALLSILYDDSDSFNLLRWTDPIGNISFGDSLFTSLPGLYTVLLRSGQSCEQTDSFRLTEDFQTFDHQIYSDTLTCNDSTAQLSITGPDSFQYIWYNDMGFSDTGQQVTTPSPGTYFVNIDDGNCQYQRAVNVIESRDAPDVQWDIFDLDCVTDTARIEFTASSNILSYYYDSISMQFIEMDTNIYRTIRQGMHTFRFIGENGCQLDTSLEVIIDTLIPSFQIAVSDTFNCRNQSIEVSMDPERPYQSVIWVQGGDTLSRDSSLMISSSANLELYLQFENGCRTDSTIQIPTDTTEPGLNFQALTLTCARPEYFLSLQSSVPLDSIQIQSPSSSYSIDSASFLIDERGSYDIRAWGNNGCFTDTIVNIGIDTGLASITLYNDTIRCGNDKVQILTRSDTQYIDSAFWILESGMNLRGITNLLPSGTHQLVILGQNGCVDTFTKEIFPETYEPVVQGIRDSVILDCDSPNINVIPNILSDYDSAIWYRGSIRLQDQLNLVTQESGNYFLELTKDGCQDSIHMNVSIDTVSAETDIMGDSLGCKNPSTTLIFNSNQPIRSLEWMGPNGFLDTTQQPLITDTGIYMVHMIDQRGCESFDSIRIWGDFQKPMYSLQDTFYRNCESGLTTVFVSTLSFNSINWYANNQNLSELDTFNTDEVGNIFLVLEGANGCRVLDSAWIEPEFKRPALVWEKPVLDCNNTQDTIKLIQSSGGELVFIWEGPNNFRAETPSPIIDTGGTYLVNVENEYNCNSAYTLSIVQKNTVIQLDLSFTDTLRCQDSTTRLQLRINRPLKDTLIQWRSIEGQILDNSDPFDIVVKGPGYFEAEVQDPADNCTSKDSIQIEFGPPADFPVDTNVKQLICEEDRGGAVTLITPDPSRAPYQFRLDNGTLTDDPLFEDLPPGLFRFTFFDRQFCTKELLVEIDEQYEDTVVDLGPDREEEAGNEAVIVPDLLIDSTFIDSIQWFVNGSIVCTNCDSITVFLEVPKLIEIRVFTSGGCMHSDQLIIEVPTDDVLFIPNVFSPNEDGNNDFFFVQTALEIPEIELLEIYGRGGNRVFQAREFPPNDIAFGWDGTFEGQLLTPQVFAVRIIYSFEGERKIEHHNLTLIR